MLLKCGRCRLNIAGFIVLIVCSAANPVQASALGGPDLPPDYIGFNTGASFVRLSDPDGDAARAWSVPFLSVLFSHPISRKWRSWSALSFQRTELSASGGNIGQQVNVFGAKLSMQRNILRWRKARVWAGVGGQISIIDASKRHTIAQDGYLGERFSDRKKTSVAMVPELVTEWSFPENWRLGLGVEQQIALVSGINAFSIGVSIQYEW